jgi:hypothetical protein
MASTIRTDKIGPADGSADFTLPTADGSAKSALITDGSKALSFATGTPSASNFLRGDGTWAEAGGGKVLQVVQSEKTDTHSSTGTSYADIAGTDQAGAGSIWCVKITPSATTSKILVMVDFVTGRSSGIGYIGSILLRDTTTIYIGDVASSRARNLGNFNTWNNDQGAVARQSATYLDDPSSTSELTYKVQMCNTQGTGTVYLNRSGADTDSSGVSRTASSITVMEIGA